MKIILNDLTVNLQNRSVEQSGEPLKLPDLSFDVLVAILSAAPSPISSEELVAQVWKSDYISDDTISQRLKLLRKAIGDSSKEPRYIRTVRGVGYSALGEVKKHEVVHTDHTPEKPPSAKKDTIIYIPKNALTIGLAATVIVVVGLAVLFSNYDVISYDDVISKESVTPKPNSELTAANSLPVNKAASATGVDDKNSYADVIIQRAQQQLSLHQPEETLRAIEMLRQVLRDQPSHYQARLTLSFALTTKTTKFSGLTGSGSDSAINSSTEYDDEKEAEELVRQLIQERPNDDNAWSALGYTLSSQGRTDEALAAFRQSYNLNPSNNGALSSAGHILLLKGDFQQSLLLEARVVNSGNLSRYSEIQIAQVLQFIEHESAQSWLDKALIANPGQAVVLTEAARFYIRKNDAVKAYALLQQFTDSEQAAPHIAQLKGRVMAMLERPVEAKASLRNAGWRGHSLLAALYASEGDDSFFNEYYSEPKLLDIISETEPELRVQLAEVYQALGDSKKAYSLIAEAISLGWRDKAWLTHSPFLKAFMQTEPGLALLQRIDREISSQRQLILQTSELSFLLY